MFHLKNMRQKNSKRQVSCNSNAISDVILMYTSDSMTITFIRYPPDYRNLTIEFFVTRSFSLRIIELTYYISLSTIIIIKILRLRKSIKNWVETHQNPTSSQI
jgi:hypothetical protein